MSTTRFSITNITCAACVKLSTAALQKIHGVTHVVVDMETGASEVTAERNIPWSEIENALTGVGKTAVLSV
ncbi:MAG: hypothetical protein A3J66_02405 [Candidatus Magasanikbacteria bacterium RIFCSPHIGHO2_02_FULL_47_14]|uniref:HMA domain-containing protein n=1 Tax=Candidatus Magasanikbacteria bacterium RIFCSPHIGHO2_02_FULL_47_14 TaxID=1798680 RepID=A0A1F6M1E4_9BACT|nr:MAG: hypothetical protein A3J66_02405 [Candidatus Magasanikbacteria bacterium RIFCSPHIGHO2_02_FULL_47_14]